MTTKTTTPPTDLTLEAQAVEIYLRRQARQDHPQGRFDKARRFYLSEACGKDCRIRTPSKRFPYSQMLHGRTLTHICGVLGADESQARKLLSAIQHA